MSATGLWFDDFVKILALLVSYGTSAMLFLDAQHGVGRHFEIMKASDYPILFQTIVSYAIPYAVTTTLIKLSILLFYQRLFGVRKTFQEPIWVVMAIVVCWCLAFVFATNFQCHPIKVAWVKPYPGAKCFNGNAYLIATSVSNLIIDCIVLVLPIWVVWNFRPSKRKKVVLSGIFFVGAFTCGAVIARTWAIADLDYNDVTWSYVRAIVWSCVEVSVDIACACLLTLQPVLNTAFSPSLGKMLDSTSKRTNAYSNNMSRNWPGAGNSRKETSRPRAKGRGGEWGTLRDGGMGWMRDSSISGTGREVHATAWGNVNVLHTLNDEEESLESG